MCPSHTHTHWPADMAALNFISVFGHVPSCSFFSFSLCSLIPRTGKNEKPNRATTFPKTTTIATAATTTTQTTRTTRCQQTICWHAINNDAPE